MQPLLRRHSCRVFLCLTGIIRVILRHTFTPHNNTRLTHLCGPADVHLRTIEIALSVNIAHRHEQFKVDGPKAKATQAVDTGNKAAALALRQQQGDGIIFRGKKAGLVVTVAGTEAPQVDEGASARVVRAAGYLRHMHGKAQHLAKGGGQAVPATGLGPVEAAQVRLLAPVAHLCHHQVQLLLQALLQVGAAGTPRHGGLQQAHRPAGAHGQAAQVPDRGAGRRDLIGNMLGQQDPAHR